MTIRLRATAAFSFAALAAGCGGSAPATLDTDDQKASYAIGLDMGSSLRPAASHVEMEALIRGIEDALAERDPAVPPEDLRAVMTAFNQTIQEEMAAQQIAAAEENVAEGEAFLAENGRKAGVTTTESGLQYEVLREGEGPNAASGQTATLHYRGTLPDGSEFDSSYGGEPANFAVDGVIPGFTEALTLMNVGSHFRVAIPSQLAYGEQGSGPVIGPNQVLIFEIELLGVE